MKSSQSAPIQRSNGKASASSDLLSSRWSWIVALGLAAGVLVVYYACLNFQFILDDHRFVGDPRIHSSGYLWDYFTTYVWAQFTGGPASFYRPIFLCWLRTNYILCESSPWGWHLLSILKHLAAAGLLGWLTCKLLGDRTAALIAATLFALHPAQVESVAWVTVPDPLMSIAIFVALLCYLRYQRSVEVRPAATKRRRRPEQQISEPAVGWLLASAAFGLIALLAKETAIVFPVIIFSIELFADAAGPAAVANRSEESFSRVTTALRHTVPFIAALVIYFLLRVHALGVALGARTQNLPLKTVVLSWPATLFFYVKVMLWPVRSYASADPTLVERFSVRGVLLPAILITAFVGVLAGLFVWAWRTAERETSQEAENVRRALIIGALLLVLPILPALNLNALNPGDFLHGRYTYLPLAGLMLLVATGWHVAGRLRPALAAVAALIAVVCVMLTIPQEAQWRDDLTLFTTAHQLAPANAPVARNLADARVRQALLSLESEGRCGEAIPIFEEVTRQYPDDWFAWAALGTCLVQLDRLPAAEEALHHAADLSHDGRLIEQWHELRAHMGLPDIPLRP